jgi:NNP family nitrate/nitrite transporter-like MFS transporter
MEHKVEYTSFRWIIFTLIFLGMVSVTATAFVAPAMANTLITELELTTSQFTIITTAFFLGLGVFGLFGGILGDRLGPKPIIFLGLLAAGVGGILRATAGSFDGLLLWTLILGAGAGFTMVNGAKSLAIWFPRREVTLVFGLSATSVGVGSTIGLTTGALFPSYQTGFTVYSIVVLVIAISWFVIAKNAPRGFVFPRSQSVITPFKVAARSKNTWWITLSFFMVGAGGAGSQVLLPHALEEGQGITPATAGIATSVLTIGVVFGSVAADGIAKKIGLLKPSIWAGLIISAASLYIGWATAMSPVAWIMFFLVGFFSPGIFIPTVQTILLRSPEIGARYLGAALGVGTAFFALGAFLIPSYIIVPLADGNFDLVMIGFAASLFLGGLLVLPASELGDKVLTKGKNARRTSD